MGDEAEVVSDWNDDTAFFDSWSDECGNFMYKEYYDTKRFMAGLYRDDRIRRRNERRRKYMRKGVRKGEERYIKAKQAKVGEEIRCAGYACGKSFVKKSYQQAFCCTKCKDNFWNKRTEFYGYRKQVDIPKEEPTTTEQETLSTTNTNNEEEMSSWDWSTCSEKLGFNEDERQVVRCLWEYSHDPHKPKHLKEARTKAEKLLSSPQADEKPKVNAQALVLDYIVYMRDVPSSTIVEMLVSLTEKNYLDVVEKIDALLSLYRLDDYGSDYDKEFWGDESPKTESPFEGKVVLFPPIDIVKKTAPSFEGEIETLPSPKAKEEEPVSIETQIANINGLLGYVRCPDEGNRIIAIIVKKKSSDGNNDVYALKEVTKTNNIYAISESDNVMGLMGQAVKLVISPLIELDSIDIVDDHFGGMCLTSKVVAEVNGEDVDLAVFVTSAVDNGCATNSFLFLSRLEGDILKILSGEIENKAFAKHIELIKHPDGSPLSNYLLRIMPICTTANFFNPLSGGLVGYVRKIDKSTWISVCKENFGDEGTSTKYATEELAIHNSLYSYVLTPLFDKLSFVSEWQSGMLTIDYEEGNYNVKLRKHAADGNTLRIFSTYNYYLASRVVFTICEHMEHYNNVRWLGLEYYQYRDKADTEKLAYIHNDVYKGLKETLVTKRTIAHSYRTDVWYEFSQIIGNEVSLACDYEDEKSAVRNITEEVITSVKLAVEKNGIVPELFASMGISIPIGLEAKVFMKDKVTQKYYDLATTYGEHYLSNASTICSELDKNFNMPYAMNNEEKKEVSLEEETIQEPLESEIDEDFLTDEDFSDEAIFGENFSCEHLSGKIAYIYIPVRNKKGGIGISVYKDDENAFSDCHVVVGGQTYDHRLCHIAIESAVDMLFQEVAKNRSDINLDAPIKMNYEKELKAYYITINTNGEDIDIACARGHYEAEQILGALRFIQEYLKNTNHAGKYANTPKKMPYYDIAYGKDGKVGGSNTRTYRLTDYDVVRVRGINDYHIVVSSSGEGEEDYVIPFNNLDTALVSLSFAVANKIAVHHTLIGEISISVMEDGGCDEYNVIVNGVGYEVASFKEKEVAVKFAKQLYKRLKEKFSN